MSGQTTGVSRREILKKSAVAGAVFWSVPVIESITSAAAAASPTGAIVCSWAYVVYIFNGTIFAAGYTNTGGGNNCHAYAANPHTAWYCHGPRKELTNYTFNLLSTSPGGADLVRFSTGGAFTPATQPPDCSHLTQNGNTVTASGGATILAFFDFHSGAVGSSGTMTNPPANNTITLPCATA